MKEQRKNLVRRFTAMTVMAGTMAAVPVLAGGPASADTTNAASASVLTNVTPGTSGYVGGQNRICCEHSVNDTCC